MKLSAIAVLTGAAIMTAAASGQSLPNLFPLPNQSGLLETYNVNRAPISLTGAFFQSLGTNGRSCASCHRPAEGWSVSAAEVQFRFLLTQGLDPIFRTNDGSNCDQNIDTSTVQARRQAYSLLLKRGLIRIALPVPAGAEFTVESVSNPYGCSDTSTPSMYRRPLPATNLEFLSTLMWDGRESTPSTPNTKDHLSQAKSSLLADLAHQAIDATTGHAQGAAPTAAQIQDIVSFETALRTAQAIDYQAGLLNAGGSIRRPGRAGFPAVLHRHQRFLPSGLWFQSHWSALRSRYFQPVHCVDELAVPLSSQHCPGPGRIQLETNYDFRRRRNKRYARTPCIICLAHVEPAMILPTWVIIPSLRP